MLVKVKMSAVTFRRWGFIMFSLGVFGAQRGKNLRNGALQEVSEPHQENATSQCVHLRDRGAGADAGSRGRNQTPARCGHVSVCVCVCFLRILRRVAVVTV